MQVLIFCEASTLPTQLPAQPPPHFLESSISISEKTLAECHERQRRPGRRVRDLSGLGLLGETWGSCEYF